MSANVIDFGADPKGQFPCDAAFSAAFATGAKVIDAPAGVYRLESDLVPPAGVRIRGDGGAFRASATTLHLAGPTTVRIASGSKAACFSDLSIRGDRYWQRDSLVSAVAEFAMERCYLLNSGKHGIRINGAQGVGNANCWELAKVTIENCGEASPGIYAGDGFGVYVSGSDAQGTGWNVRVVSSFGGIADRSFLGCSWSDAFVEGCVGRGYLSDTARSVWVGCYCELDSPVSMGSCIVLGGTLAASARSQVAPPAGRAAPAVIDASEATPMLIRSKAGATSTRSFLGFSDGRTPFAFQAGEDAHEFGFTAHGSGASKVWAVARARALALASLVFTREGHSLGPDQLVAPKGIHLPAAQGTHRRVDAAWFDLVEARIKALEEAP